MCLIFNPLNTTVPIIVIQRPDENLRMDAMNVLQFFYTFIDLICLFVFHYLHIFQHFVFVYLQIQCHSAFLDFAKHVVYYQILSLLDLSGSRDE